MARRTQLIDQSPPGQAEATAAAEDAGGLGASPPEISRPGLRTEKSKVPPPLEEGPPAALFRPKRAAGAPLLALLAVLFVALGVAWRLALLPALPLAVPADIPVYAAWSAGALFLLAAAWIGGQRARVDDEALLVHMAAGEDGDALMVSDAQGRVLYANRAFRVLFKSTSGLIVPTLFRFAASDDEASPRAVKRILDAAAGGARDHEELAFSLPRSALSGGTVTWYRLCAFPMAGALVGWRAEDVSARRELEAVRRREEFLLSDLLDNLPVGFFSVDGAGRLVYANETLCAWLGVTLHDIRERGLGFADFVVESGRTYGDDDGSGGQVILQPVDAETFSALLLQTGRENDDGELLYTRSVVVRDLVRKPAGAEGPTPPVEADDAQALARHLYWLFNEAPVAIVLLDLQANIADCNGAFLKMLGLHKDDVLGHHFIERLAKEDRGDVNAQLSKVVMGILRAAHLEARLPASGGREVTASLYASRMEDAYGEVTGLIVHFIDTTEQKHLEVQFAQSQKMHSIGQLAGGIAHDFNNLLTAMIGFCDLLLARHGPGDPSFGDIDQIRQNAVRATALVRQLLAFSRKQTLSPQKVDVKEKLFDLLEVLGRLLGATIELDIEHERDVWSVRVDPVQFDQVILNLAVNARDAMPGGGTLTIRTSNLTLGSPTQRGMAFAPAGEYVVVEVIDTGEGIRKEDLNRIFEPFFTTKDVGDGTGLGLSTVYGIVHQTGGHVLVDSAPGEGTTFTVCLPRDQETSQTPAAEHRPGKDAQTPEGDLTGVGTILLVEDEDAVRMFGARALSNKGYTVLEAANAEEALEVINATERKIDLIVTDVMMPGMDGHTLVQFVRQEMPDMKVIFISGYAENVISGGIQAAGDDAFLPKPFSLKELAAKVKSVLT